MKIENLKINNFHSFDDVELSLNGKSTVILVSMELEKLRY